MRGLVINRFTGAGISIAGGNGNTVIGNYIGTDVGGTLALPNGGGGIVLSSSNNTIGGATAALRNVVSGNQGSGININGGSGNIVRGNYVGLNASGAAAIGNTPFGISVFNSQSNVIGGSGPGEGNVVSASSSINIGLQGSANNNTLQGNLVGTDATGSDAVGTNQSGIYLIGSSNNLIGGTSAGARNVVAGSTGTAQLVLSGGSDGNNVQGNYIGPNVAGTAAIPNTTWGVQITSASNNVIGGTVAGAGNLISGNAGGGVVFFGTSTANSVQGNRIGTAADGVTPLPNQSYGVGIQGPSGNVIGGATTSAGNVIAFNTGAGVVVFSGTQNQIRNNRILSNGALGIDLGSDGVTQNDLGDGDTGANNLQNFPVLTSAIASGPVVTVQGTLNSTPNTTFQVEIFAGGADPTGFGEGAMPLAGFSVSTNETGSASFTTEVANVANILTATASDPNGNTSEFSATVAVTSAPAGATIAATDATAAELGNDNGDVCHFAPARRADDIQSPRDGDDRRNCEPRGLRQQHRPR